MSNNSEQIDIVEIMNCIPHRYPMLLVDRIIEFEKEESAVGLKNVTFNEQFFQGHFPGAPVMPGVLIVEAMAQTAGILVVHSMDDPTKDKLVYFMTIDNARFRKPVTPGDTMHIHVQKVQSRANVWKFEGKAMVNGQLHAQATFSAMIVDREQTR